MIAQYSYDAYGRRQSKTQNGSSIGYVYDGLNITQELNSASVDNSNAANIKASYLMGGIDEVFAQQTGSNATAQTLNYFTDALGSTVRLTNTTGAKVIDYTYDEYGNTTADAATANPFQYTGRENDGNGLYYYRARYYSPSLQRFISEDPIGLNGGMNMQLYASANPIKYRDPLGLWVVAVGVTGGFGSTPVGVNAGFGVVFDGSGNVGTYNTYGAGVGVTEGGSVGISIGVLGKVGPGNPTTISDYGGPFNNTDIGAGAGPSGGVTIFSDPAIPNNVGVGITVGIGVKGSVTQGISNTTVTPKNSIDPTNKPKPNCS